jgi:small neutral amino acid transporter SnatA (MarC family)
MSLALLGLAAVAVVNPARLRAALPEREAGLVGALGVAIAWLALLPLAAFADPILGALQVAGSTLRMAAGVVLGLQGAVAVLSGPPGLEPALAGRRAALMPVAFPLTLTPGLAMLVLSASVDRSAPVALAVQAGALVTVPVLAAVSPSAGSPSARRVLDGLGRLTGAVLVLSGLGLVLNGVFDI